MPSSTIASSSMTDAHWALLEPLLPAPGSAHRDAVGGPEKYCRRLILDAIFYEERSSHRLGGSVATHLVPLLVCDVSRYTPAAPASPVASGLTTLITLCQETTSVSRRAAPPALGRPSTQHVKFCTA